MHHPTKIKMHTIWNPVKNYQAAKKQEDNIHNEEKKSIKTSPDKMAVKVVDRHSKSP